MLLVVDTSLSMSLPYNLDPNVEDRLYELQESGSLFDQIAAMQLLQQIDQSPGPERIDVAKSAMQDIVTAAPEDVRFGLVSFNICASPNYHGNYAYPQRPALQQTIQQLTMGEYTALADTLSSLHQITDAGRSPDRPMNIILLSDGVDSCEGDPCAAARQLKSQMPEGFVHVIAISQRIQELSCISDITGGLFLQAADADSLAEQLRQATGQDLPAHCR